MRTFAFAKRNFKEIIRDPLSLVFCFIFPIVLFLMMKLIMNGVVQDFSQTPQFKTENLYMGICLFSFTFLALFSSMLISKDRETSFQTRLNVSPIKPHEFIFGYVFPLLPIACSQILVATIMAFILGLSFSWNLLLVFVGFIPAVLLFLGLGVLIGAIFNDKAASGISSLIINIAVLLSGMFFPLDIMTGALPVICNILPFAPSLKIVKCFYTGNYAGFGLALLTVAIYLIIIYLAAILVFIKKIKSDKK